MAEREFSRRDFSKLALAALGGVLIGCSRKEGSKKHGSHGDIPTQRPEGESPLLSEPHVCRGLNTCKGLGVGGANDCAGQGACASAEKHTCHYVNQCKGQGGCGSHPGENACQGKGTCGVPLGDGAWKRARKNFEQVMTTAGKKFGAAPSKGD
jgi:hypothetical protein